MIPVNLTQIFFLTFPAISMAMGAANGDHSIFSYKNSRNKYMIFDSTEKSWDLQGLSGECNWSEQWVCNPDKILSDDEESRIDSHLQSGAIYEDDCQIKLRVIMTKNLADHLEFGYPQGLGLVPLHPAMAHHWLNWLKIKPYSHQRSEPLDYGQYNEGEDLEDDSDDNTCCHTMLIVSRQEMGRLRYGVALCDNFPIDMCHIQRIFDEHAGGLYDPRYIRYGLKELWDALREKWNLRKEGKLSPCPTHRTLLTSGSPSNRRWWSTANISLTSILSIITTLTGILCQYERNL